MSFRSQLEAVLAAIGVDIKAQQARVPGWTVLGRSVNPGISNDTYTQTAPGDYYMGQVNITRPAGAELATTAYIKVENHALVGANQATYWQMRVYDVNTGTYPVLDSTYEHSNNRGYPAAMGTLLEAYRPTSPDGGPLYVQIYAVLGSGGVQLRQMMWNCTVTWLK